MDKTVKGADVVAEILKAEGVEFLVGFPLNQVFDSVAERGIRPIIARTERVAVNIADGFSRMTGGRRIGVAAVQYGPGSEAAFPGVAEAFSDNVPLLCLAGSYERERMTVHPNFKAGLNYKFVTKWAETVYEVDWIPQMMRRAFALMRTGKPGPVLIELPKDILTGDSALDSLDYTPSRASRPGPDPVALRAALETFLAAERPVILAGQGVHYAEAWDELREFAELVQAPVASTLNGKSVFPENHPLSLGAGNGLSRTLPVQNFLKRCDLVFGIGTSFTKSLFIQPIPAGKTMIQATIDESDFCKDYPVAQGVIGDAKATLSAMINAAREILGSDGRGTDEALMAEIKAEKKSFLEAYLPRLTSDEEPISPYRAIWELMHTVDRTRTVVTHDSGSPRDQTVPFWESLVPHGYLGWGKSTPLGSGLGLIMGAKLAKPDWLAVNIMGDAAFGMVGMDFETAVRNNIPIMTVLLNNRVMGGYSKKQAKATELYGINRLSGDYAKVAEGLGGYVEHVEKIADLKPAFQRAIAATENGRAAFVEVMTCEDQTLPGV